MTSSTAPAPTPAPTDRPAGRPTATPWAVEEHGAALGTATVVLVHGIGASARYFRRLARALSPDARVLVPDLPGFGRSPRPERAPSITELADGLVERLAAQGIDRAVLVGHSMGAQVVAEAARRHPAVAERAVLLGPVVEAGARSAPEQAARLVRDTVYESVTANAIVFTDYARAGVRWYARQLPHMLDFPVEDAVAEVRCPVLVVRGEQDRVASDAWVVRLARTAPDGRAAVVPGAAHVVHHSHPGVVADLCRGLSPRGARWVEP